MVMPIERPHGLRRLFRPPERPLRTAVKVAAAAAVLYFFVLPLVPDFGNALRDLRNVQPLFVVLAIGCQVGTWSGYALLTRACLGEAGQKLSFGRMFRIQLSTKAFGNLVPGGAVAGPGLGYRLLVRSGITGRDAGFALGTAALGSAVVLNVLLWAGLVISLPMRGFSPLYVLAALFGVLTMAVGAVIVIGLMEGKSSYERPVRWLAVRLRRDPDSASALVRNIGARLETLSRDRRLLRRVVANSSCNWLLDAASLWCFLHAFDQNLGIDALLISFGIANVLAAIPISPGGLGVVDWAYLTTLVGFGLPLAQARLGVASYRSGQYLLPILVGLILYASLQHGPWSIDRSRRRTRLNRRSRAPIP